MESPDAAVPPGLKPAALPGRVRQVLGLAGIDPSRAESGPAGYRLPLHDDGYSDRPAFVFRPAARRLSGFVPGAVLLGRRAWDWDAYYQNEHNPYARPGRSGRGVPDARLAEELCAAMTAAEMTAVLRRDGIDAWLHDHSFDGTRQVTGALPGGRVFVVHEHGHQWPGEADPLPEELDLSLFPPDEEPAPGTRPAPDFWAEDRQVITCITAARALRELRTLHREETSRITGSPRPAAASRRGGTASRARRRPRPR